MVLSKKAVGVNHIYVWVEKSEFALGRMCVNQLHVDYMAGYLSLNYQCVSLLKQKWDLQSATLNSLRIAVIHHCKPPREEDGDGHKINECYLFSAVFEQPEISGSWRFMSVRGVLNE